MSTADFEQTWGDLRDVGRSASSGGYFRQPFGSAERECHAWFVEAAVGSGLRVEHDGFGNTVAWWEPAGAAGSAVLTGSHLDSVLDGGAYDGPLGVVSALSAIARLRERGVEPRRRLGVGVFVEEEGSRFGLACLGSRLATGALDAPTAAALTDRDGVRLGDAWADAGLDPGSGSSLLDNVGVFVELHVEQGRDLVDRGEPVSAASAIWPHGRYRFDFAGEANHAGTTRMEDRHDPMLSYAMTALAAAKQARLAEARATFGRVQTVPNSTNAVPSRLTAWLDARAASDDALADLVGAIERQAGERADRDGTALSVTPESVSGAVAFDADLAHRLASAGGRSMPIIATQAGHDAGLLAAAGIPTGMLFVRNPTGVSHSPAEHAETADCLTGVEVLADVLESLVIEP